MSRQTVACFDCLPPYVAGLSMKERSNFVNFHKALRCVPSYSGLLPEEVVRDKDTVKWAYNVAVTRSIEWNNNGERLIAPMADMVSTFVNSLPPSAALVPSTG
mmetsp:Transcript_39814/g.119737  ORF Transcript_39814/g.119737 Transcript_39814/m.119737 type:complete len:103 (+) Transcript_39814:816-1124(+)